jgi:hypothetical protein
MKSMFLLKLFGIDKISVSLKLVVFETFGLYATYDLAETFELDKL